MTKQLRLPGISLCVEECTQCGASSGVSGTLGKSIVADWLVFATSFDFFRSCVRSYFHSYISVFPCLGYAKLHLEDVTKTLTKFGDVLDVHRGSETMLTGRFPRLAAPTPTVQNVCSSQCKLV